MIENIISVLSVVSRLPSIFQKKFIEVTISGGYPTHPENEKRNLNKNEIIDIEPVPWGEVGQAVIHMRNGDRHNVEESYAYLQKKIR